MLVSIHNYWVVEKLGKESTIKADPKRVGGMKTRAPAHEKGVVNCIKTGGPRLPRRDVTSSGPLSRLCSSV